MAAAGRPCPLCEETLAPVRLPPIAGDEAPMRLTLHGMPAIACATGHTYFAKRDFALWLMDELLEQRLAALPAGVASGLLFRRHACGGCGAPLAALRGERREFRLEVAYPGREAFAVGIGMPAYRCTGCGREQLHSLAELRKLAPAALVHAFKAGGIKAPG